MENTKNAEHTISLSKVLAETYTLYLKTQNYHWNVRGPMFQTLHTMFEAQYTEMALSIDEIAERIRSLGVRAPGSYSEFANLSEVKEDTSWPKAMDMVKNLLGSHQQVSKTIKKSLMISEEGGDQPTADLLTARLQSHEKTIWMLKALSEES